MIKKDKRLLVENLSQSFNNQGAIIICNYKGMTVKDLESIRRKALKNNLKVKVIKNTLAKIALKKANCQNIEFNENNIFIWGEDEIAVCKLAYESEENHTNKFKIRAGLLKSDASNLDVIIKMAKLPSKNELISMLLNVWMAPIRNITIGLNQLAKNK